MSRWSYGRDNWMISLGANLRRLAQHRLVVAASAAVALAAAVLVGWHVSVFPPRLVARGDRVAGAHTQILVDSAAPGVLANGYSADDFTYLHAGALLLAGIMVNDAFQARIADRAQLPTDEIHFSAPQTLGEAVVEQPRVRANSPYGLVVAARPSVPVLDVYAEAPSESEAIRLVNAAYDGVHDYLQGTGANRSFHLRVTQLGRGAAVSAGSGTSRLEVVGVFAAVFAAFCGLWLLVSGSLRKFAEPNRRIEAAA